MIPVTISGTITRCRPIKKVGDSQVLGFGVAYNYYDGKNKSKEVIFFNCSVWGKRCDSLEGILDTGAIVECSGELSLELYEGKIQHNLRVSNLRLLKGGGKTSTSADAADEEF